MGEKMRFLRLSLVGVFAGIFLLAPGSGAITLPASFQDSVVFSGLTQPTAIEFAADGRIFVGQKNGDIKVFDSLSDSTPDVFTNINNVDQLRGNVHDFWDRGFLGMALDPGFTTGRPYVYVLYTYDARIGGSPPTYGDGCGDPTVNGCIVSARLSRLTANGNFMTGSELVLINDWCQQFPSHSIGSLGFGADGMLYVSGGDGASFNYVDYGQTGNPCTDPTSEGGALRSQDLRTPTDTNPPPTPPNPNTTLDGSILRIDPNSPTGAAAPGNPLIGSSDLNARRIIAHGVRNPFRFTIRPGTSEVWLGDVGWNTWEEINRIADPLGTVENFGWPCYEGVGQQPGYRDSANVGICPGLYAAGPNAVVAPYYTYNHGAHIVSTENCATGSSSISGLAFYQGGSYPSAYNGALFFSDYSRGCIWVMFPGGNGLPDPNNLATFVDRTTPATKEVGPVELQIGPGGDLFYADYDNGTIHRIRYTATPPTPGLAAAYSFNEGGGTTVADTSGNGNGGTIGTATWSTAGKFGNALSFNGTSAKVTVPDSNSLDLTSGMTLEAWVFPTAIGNWRDAVYKGQDDIYYLMASSDRNGAAPAAGGTWSSSPLAAPSNLTTNAWSHLAATYDGQTLRLYVNGVQVASRAQTGSIATSTGALTIGGDALYGQYFAGRIDEVRVYNTALSAAQVQADMNTAIGGGPPPDTSPPTNPSALSATAVSTSQINLSWTGSTDNVQVTGYRIERCQGAGCSNFAEIAATSGTGTTFSNTGLSAGTSYSYRVRAQDAVPNFSGFSNTASATTQGVSNTAPTATIDAPPAGTTWKVGDRIDFSGSATDLEDGAPPNFRLPSSSLSWTLVIQHCPSNCHSHTVWTRNGISSDFFLAPDHEYPSYLELTLTATDSGGLTDSETLRLDPRTVDLTFQTSPSGLQLTVGSTSQPAPFTRTVIQGSQNSISAPSPQTLGGTTYTFSSWSDGLAQSHDIFANAAATYTATYQAVASADLRIVKTLASKNGQTATWSLVVTNLGPQTAQNVVVTDTLPSRLDFVSAPGCTYAPTTRVVTCNLGSLASGASNTITLTTTITGNAGGWITNTAQVTSSTSDPVSANNSSTDRVRAK
jgi:uncharacterized repeat protein (TIGR01451 family)